MSRDVMKPHETAVVLSFIYLFVTMLAIVGVAYFSLNPHTLRLLSEMPPTGSIYSIVDVGWMRKGLHFAYGILAVANYILAVVSFVFTVRHEKSTMRFMCGLLTVQLTGIGLMCSANVLILEIGGLAHLFALILALSTTIATVLMVLMVVMKREHVGNSINMDT